MLEEPTNNDFYERITRENTLLQVFLMVAELDTCAFRLAWLAGAAYLLLVFLFLPAWNLP